MAHPGSASLGLATLVALRERASAATVPSWPDGKVLIHRTEELLISPAGEVLPAQTSRVAHDAIMDVSSKHLLRSTQTRRIRKSNSLVMVVRGTYVATSYLEGEKPWDVRRRVAQARLLATMRHGVLFTGESALVTLGIEPWWNNPDVTVRTDARSGKPALFPAVPVGEIIVPSVAWHCRRSGPMVEGLEAEDFWGMPLAPIPLLAYDLCQRAHPLQAFHNVSAFLRFIAGFDRWDLVGSRIREARWREHLIQEVSSLGMERGHRRTQAVLESASGGIESPAESTVLWVLACLVRGRQEVVCQHEVQVRGRRFFVDIALPEEMIAIEVSGMGKFGGTAATADEVALRFSRRQQLLTDSGWRFINVYYEQCRDLSALVVYLRERLCALGVTVSRPGGKLWAAQSPELFHRDRKF